MFERKIISAYDRLCRPSTPHIEHWNLYQLFEFRNYPDAYLSKPTNLRLTHMTSALQMITHALWWHTLCIFLTHTLDDHHTRWWHTLFSFSWHTHSMMTHFLWWHTLFDDTHSLHFPTSTPYLIWRLPVLACQTHSSHVSAHIRTGSNVYIKTALMECIHKYVHWSNVYINMLIRRTHKNVFLSVCNAWKN